MDFLKEKIRPLYFKYLSAAFGSALITSIYSIVDMAIVGQYHGPSGTAALAAVAPVWNIIYSLGLLTGVGGSVLFSAQKGAGKGNENQYFTVAVTASVVISLIVWPLMMIFERQVLSFFGADSALMPLAQKYLLPIKFVLPLFLFNQMLAAGAVLAGGIFNVFGDYFFVFTLNMGIFGAGLATAIGSAISFIVFLTHFKSKKNTLAFEMPQKALKKLKEITVTGFSTFFIDIAMGILTILFNRQIMKYLGADALAVYGPIINISTLVQCCAYSVGQAAQPIISANLGAGLGERIKETLKYALYTSAVFGIFWTAVIFAFPSACLGIFMKPTAEISAIAPKIIRCYSVSFLLLPFNIFSTYYLQAMLKPTAAFIVSVMRIPVISGILIMLLPAVLGADLIWFAMPVTELIIMFLSVFAMRKCDTVLEKNFGL